MRSREFRNSRRILPLGFITVAGVATLLLAADAIGPDELKARRERIEKMSTVEREDLERKYAKFNALPDERKESFRLIHQALQEGEYGRKLDEVLLNYDAWLQTLSPWQRDEIRAARTPAERLEIVRHFKSAQEADGDRPGPGPEVRSSSHGQEGSPKRSNRRFRFVRLDREDLNRVMDVLQRAIPIPDGERQEIEQLQAPHRHVRLLLAASRQPQEEERESLGRSWPSDDLLREMIDAIQNERIRNELRGDEHRRQKVKAAVVWGVLGEAKEELNRLLPDKGQVVQEYISGLEEKKKKRLLMQGLDDNRGKQDQLAWMYLDEVKHDPFAHDVIRLQKAWFPRGNSGGSGQRWGRRPSFDGKPGGDFRTRDRRPDDGPPPDDRPRGEEGPGPK